MKHHHISTLGLIISLTSIILLPANLHADTFGSGANTFTIDFVTIGNAGNANDAGAGGGSYSSPYGGVGYTYRMGTNEISENAITKATAGGMTNVTAGQWTAGQPAGYINWYEMAAFVNWLNTSTGHPPAYNLTFSTNWSLTLWSSAQAWQADGENLYRNKDAYYFLPSEDEWYKAAYHKNDGVTANYWDYATGSNTIPTAVTGGTAAGTAVYNSVTGAPAAVDNNGGLSAYGTRGQTGNAREWLESAYDGANNSATEDRVVLGGSWGTPAGLYMTSAGGFGVPPSNPSGASQIGFRIASVPEPASLALILLAGGTLLLRRKRM